MKTELQKQLDDMRVALKRISELSDTFPDDVPSVSVVPHFGGQLRFWKPDKARMAALFGTEGWKREDCSWRNSFDYAKVLPCGVKIIAEAMETPEQHAIPQDVDPAIFGVTV